jgi:molecular chaperone DnaK
MDERIFTEARLKADEMLPAVDTALETLGEEVSADTRALILDLVEKIRAALEKRETPVLKKLLQELDAATEPLAAALIQKTLA